MTLSFADVCKNAFTPPGSQQGTAPLQHQRAVSCVFRFFFLSSGCCSEVCVSSDPCRAAPSDPCQTAPRGLCPAAPSGRCRAAPSDPCRAVRSDPCPAAPSDPRGLCPASSAPRRLPPSPCAGGAAWTRVPSCSGGSAPLAPHSV